MSYLGHGYDDVYDDDDDVMFFFFQGSARQPVLLLHHVGDPGGHQTPKVRVFYEPSGLERFSH